MSKIQLQLHYVTTLAEAERRIAMYEAWAEHHAIDPFWRWFSMADSVIWLSPARRMLWVVAHDPKQALDPVGHLVIAFDAVMAAFETEHQRAARHAPFVACGLSFYVRAAYRRRGVGTALWRATSDWLRRYAPEVSHLVFEPPARCARDVMRVNGFFLAPRNCSDRVLAFATLRPDAHLGGMAELLVGIEETEEADMHAKAFGVDHG